MPAQVDDLVQKQRIASVITQLFVATDERDWSRVRECLDDSVLLDMTSLAGGQPVRMSPSQITEIWDEGLRPIEAVHHQAGNFDITWSGQEAKAACYGIAYHYRRTQSGRDTRLFVGSYGFELRLDEKSNWRITMFRFNLKFIDGNRDLDREPRA